MESQYTWYMQRAMKVYGFGTAFYNELQASQKSQRRYFTYVLIFFAILIFFILWLLPPTFAKDMFRISSLQLRILGTTGVLSIIILLRFLYEKYVIQRNLIIDIEEWDDNWLPIEAKIADFWFAKTLHLRWISYEAHIVLQFPYKKRPLRVKVICPIVTMPEYIAELTIQDPLMKNMMFLIWLVKKLLPDTLADDQKKHLLHKRISHILNIQKTVTIYMDQSNQYNPYVDISLTSLFSTSSNVWYIVMLDRIKKICRFIFNCVAIYYISFGIISLLLWAALLLQRITT